VTGTNFREPVILFLPVTNFLVTGVRSASREQIQQSDASLLVMSILIHPHARERMEERGATEDEVRVAISRGERFSAKLGRVGFKRNFPFESKRDGRFFRIKQVVVYGVEEGEDFIVITVVVRYF
jgi:hypothetical protein